MNEPQPQEPWFARWERERKESVSRAKVTLHSLCEQFAAKGIEKVRFAYDGYGDSGDIEQITALANGREVPLEEPLHGDFYNAAYDLLPAGWEINDGSFGELVLNVPERRLTRAHNWRITETDHEEEEWEL